MEIVWFALSAFGGGIVSALLGFYKSGEPFSDRKFLPSVLSALIAGVGTAVTYPLVDTLGLWSGIGIAFLAGAGVDAGLHRFVGAIKK